MTLYVVTNLVNGKQYVGIAVDFERRCREHISGRGSKIVHQAIQKYGIDNLAFEAWYEGDEEWIKTMERRAILALHTLAPSGYNLTFGGEGSLGWRASEETKRKMSEARRGRKLGPHSEETRRKISEARKGKECSPEVLARLREMNGRGADHPCAKPVTVNGVRYGCMKDAAKGLGVSAGIVRRLAKSGETTYVPFDRKRHARRCSLASKGWKHSPETRRRMSEARRGAKSCRAKRVLVNGVEHGCIKEAADALGVNYSTLRWRLQQYAKSGNWPVGTCYLAHDREENN
jgi:group I intron endonuclease